MSEITLLMCLASRESVLMRSYVTPVCCRCNTANLNVDSCLKHFRAVRPTQTAQTGFSNKKKRVESLSGADRLKGMQNELAMPIFPAIESIHAPQHWSKLLSHIGEGKSM